MNTLYEIKQLAKDGRVEEAYEACRDLLKQYPEDRDVKLQLAWCIKALAEVVSKNISDYKRFVGLLSELAELKPWEFGEISMANRFAWTIKGLFDNSRSNPDSLFLAADAIFDIVKCLNFRKPDRYYSVLVDAFLKVKNGKKPWPRFKAFMDWWGFENFQSGDYEKIPLRNGDRMPSLVERVYGSYYRVLTDLMKTGQADLSEVDDFLSRLEGIFRTHPEFQYTLYQKSRILLMLKRNEDAINSLRPFVIRKNNDYWVWEILGDAITDKDIRLSCYCRALLCRAEPEYLGKLRFKTAQLLCSMGFFAEAKHEVDQYIMLYRSKGWRISQEIENEVNKEWYRRASATTTNNDFYLTHLKPSEDFLYSEMPEIPIWITNCNNERKIVNFVTKSRQSGFFRAKEYLKLHQVYMARIDGNIEESKPTKVPMCKEVEDLEPYKEIFFQEFSGRLRKTQGKSFGFVGDIYVEGRLLGADFVDGDSVGGIAELNYERAKRKWGWKAFILTKKDD